MGFTLNLRMRKNVRSYHSNLVAWQRSANKDADILSEKFRSVKKCSYSKIPLFKSISPLIKKLSTKYDFYAPIAKYYGSWAGTDIPIDK